MSRYPIREDKHCLNCDHIVEERYCPHCGQENILSRKTFHHLFQDFFEDLTHYDKALWKTLFMLIFKPASLTKAYMDGKRKSYLPPIRLCIFITFITFLIISFFPNQTIAITTKPVKKEAVATSVPSIDSLHIEEKSIDGLTKIGIISQDSNDTIKKILTETEEINPKAIINLGYKNVKELDSIQKNAPAEVKANPTQYWFIRKWLKVKEGQTDEEIIKKFTESFSNNLPKVLFMYMPVFALLLWLFHDKKKWYYFDHGIFTLHYFAFLMLIILLLFFIDKLQPLMAVYPALEWIHFSLKYIAIAWMLIYFFPAHRIYYGDKFLLSFLKSILIFVINIILVSILMITYGSYTYLTMT